MQAEFFKVINNFSNRRILMLDIVVQEAVKARQLLAKLIEHEKGLHEATTPLGFIRLP
jgi:hypothetical protein